MSAKQKLTKTNIDIRREALLDVVGYNPSYKHFSKRSITNTIKNIAHVLFGVCDALCSDTNLGHIQNIHNSENQQLDVLDKQIKIIKSGMTSLHTLTKNLNDNTQVISKQLDKINQSLTNIATLNEIGFAVTQQFLLLNALTDQYDSDTNLLSDLIHAAQVGQIHSSIITPSELLDTLKDIKVHLPKSTDLPVGFTTADVGELLKISETTIFSKDQTIVFVIDIPIVNQIELNLYNLIPLPKHVTNDKYIYIDSNYDYIAVSKSKDYYTTFNNLQILQCKRTKNFILCPQYQPLHPKSMKPICEIELFFQPPKLPLDCKIKYFELDTSIFHKLLFKNSWLYITREENILLTCNENIETSNTRIHGVGLIHIPINCKAYSNQDVLIPNIINENIDYIDFVPQINITNTSYTDKLNILNVNKLLTDHVLTNKLNDVKRISESLLNVPDKLNQKDFQYNVITNTRRHDMLLYTICTIIILYCLYFVSTLVTKLFPCNNRIYNFCSESVTRPTNTDGVGQPLSTTDPTNFEDVELQPRVTAHHIATRNVLHYPPLY
ncbi:uncharacterized protein LOC126834051 [Adelges cooleyi]|uniref:uncharacterized protein LOC126834051 n=1 Tax=Adelges cooleyi TaxID=133065 RepID=UPI00217FA55B|nr:uncharacterized protein LOC126834051 [Adelges cooleyi]